MQNNILSYPLNRSLSQVLLGWTMLPQLSAFSVVTMASEQTSGKIRLQHLTCLIQDRGGSPPTDPVSAQQRLKAILQEDRLDTPAPGSQIREGFQVIASVVYPYDEPPVTLPRAVETMLSQHFATITAAKKAIRRREILVAGKVCDTSR